ncbi:hypothetical protein BST63_27470 [Bradyrhizobium canariense]|uniref:Uncharacterized protein n=1 Tax=Bradyrhizobium canariense TaxID=255045 RepID=A0ABX3WY82_9BRAD|nr:hypothetical protein BST63_27470 [Bradyrhizobium canariense]
MKRKQESPQARRRFKAKPGLLGTEKSIGWKHADDRLDEALQDTFPASDALSITQGPWKLTSP